MTARAYDIMRELPAIFATVTGLDAADVEVGRYRDPSGIETDQLPRVLVYNPTTEEPDAPAFGLRAMEFGYAVLVVNDIDTEEATLQLCEEMAVALNAAALTNADTAFMNPGSVLNAEQSSARTIVGAFMFAQWEGL